MKKDMFTSDNCILIILNYVIKHNSEKIRIKELLPVIKSVYRLNDKNVNIQIIWYIGRLAAHDIISSYNDEFGYYYTINDQTIDFFNENYNNLDKKNRQYVDLILSV